jgi:hypothetical protein
MTSAIGAGAAARGLHHGDAVGGYQDGPRYQGAAGHQLARATTMVSGQRWELVRQPQVGRRRNWLPEATVRSFARTSCAR